MNLRKRLSLKKLIQRWKFGREIKKIAQGGEIPYPDALSKRIDHLLEHLPEDRQPRVRIPYYRYGMLLAGIACILLVMSPASANLQGYWQRMLRMTESEKLEQVSTLQESDAEVDYYSRSLTDTEKQRMEKLRASYEAGETYPTGEITYIDSQAGILQSQVCFLAKDSTFYLPADQLTDEQLLEIIDFRNKRAYSLSLSESAAQDNDNREHTDQKNILPGKNKISRQEAITICGEWIQKIYGITTEGWEPSVVITDNPKYGYHIYEVSFTEAHAPEEYTVLLHAETEELLEINCANNGGCENMAKGLSIRSRKQLMKRYKEVKKIAKKVVASKKLTSCHCEYYMDTETDQLSFGVVNYRFTCSDGTGLDVHYSYNSCQYYLITFINDVDALSGHEGAAFTSKSSTRKFVRLKLE